MANEIDLLIVGAGPTGLTLACFCRQLGMNLRIIDKNSGPATTSKAIGLQYRISEVLAYMGVVDRFLQRSGSPTPVNIYEGDHRLVTLNFDLSERHCGRGAFRPRPILIPQSDTEQILGQLLQERAGKIEWGTEFLSFTQDEEKVNSTIRWQGGEEQISSRWLVSCEGTHSTIRKQAGISFEGKTYPQSFALADVEIDWQLSHDENHVWMHKDGSFATLPLPTGPKIWRIFCEIRNQGEDYSRGVTLEFIKQLMAVRTGRADVPIRNPSWLSEFRLNCRMVDRFRVGRVFVAGDAAHIHSPTGGQGITTGVQDAVNLAWKLDRVLAGAPDALLDTYEEERLPKAKEVLAETDRTTTVFFSANPAMRLFRDHLVLPVLRMKSVQKKMFGKLSQLHVNYRGSSLSRREANGWRGRPRLLPGDRAPDVAFQEDNGQMTTLFKLLQKAWPVIFIGPEAGGLEPSALPRLLEALARLKTNPFMLIGKSESQSRAGASYLKDVYGDFHDLYGLDKEFLCLIRPDGHIGLIQRPIKPKALKNYLRLLCSGEAIEAAFSGLS